MLTKTRIRYKKSFAILLPIVTSLMINHVHGAEVNKTDKSKLSEGIHIIKCPTNEELQMDNLDACSFSLLHGVQFEYRASYYGYRDRTQVPRYTLDHASIFIYPETNEVVLLPEFSYSDREHNNYCSIYLTSPRLKGNMYVTGYDLFKLDRDEGSRRIYIIKGDATKIKFIYDNMDAATTEIKYSALKMIFLDIQPEYK